MKPMTSIVQVEYRLGLLSIRQEGLASLGHPVISVVGSRAARNLDLSNRSPGVIVIGHGASRQERQDLINYFRQAVPGVPLVHFCAVAMTTLTPSIATAGQTIHLSG
jgi:hypothetical protein